MSGTLASDILATARLRPGAVALAGIPGENTDVGYGELATLAGRTGRVLDARTLVSPESSPRKEQP
ncbi:hypothetical protein ACL07V_28530 [Streptomyces sp. MB22_4]|uniref:hypothetical protein n=1 Tax=Streptomyces sp. MB22_4 TaxID=3383120 RepID=UPI0039A0A7DB